MEGLIPFVYRAIMQYKNGNQVGFGSWYGESPSASYMRLPGDSGRFQTSDLFQHDYGSMSVAPNSATSTKIILSTGVQSPVCRLTTRRVATWSSIHHDDQYRMLKYCSDMPEESWRCGTWNLSNMVMDLW